MPGTAEVTSGGVGKVTGTPWSDRSDHVITWCEPHALQSTEACGTIQDITRVFSFSCILKDSSCIFQIQQEISTYWVT